MNEVIQTIHNHRSIRDYKQEPIKQEHLDAILTSAQMAPTSVNGQQMSIIIVRDQRRKAEIARLAGNQTFINDAPLILVFCMDYYRLHLACQKQGTQLNVTDKLESTIVGSVDVGLAMANAITTSESLGLGTVPIGGIRNHPEAIIELLDLPEYVFPLCGLVIGYPNDFSNKKPRLPKEAAVFEETYNTDLHQAIDEYDQTFSDYMLKRSNGESNRSWTERMAQVYERESKRDIQLAMAKQGFKNK